MGLSQIVSGLLENSNLHTRFQGVVVKQAGVVLAEDPGTALHADRVVWANSVMNAGLSDLSAATRKVLKIALATNATIQGAGAEATDEQIETAVILILANAENLATLTRKSGLTVIYEAMQAGMDVHKRFQAAAVKAAGTIFAESGGTPLHAERLIWAKKVFGQTNGYLAETALRMTRIGFATVNTIRNQAENVGDGPIETAVASILANADYLLAVT